MQYSDRPTRALRARLTFADVESLDAPLRRKVYRRKQRAAKYIQRAEFSGSKC